MESRMLTTARNPFRFEPERALNAFSTPETTGGPSNALRCVLSPLAGLSGLFKHTTQLRRSAAFAASSWNHHQARRLPRSTRRNVMAESNAAVSGDPGGGESRGFLDKERIALLKRIEAIHRQWRGCPCWLTCCA